MNKGKIKDVFYTAKNDNVFKSIFVMRKIYSY